MTADDELTKRQAREIAQAFRRYPKVLHGHLRRALVKSGNEWRSAMRQRMRAPLPKPGQTNLTLHRRSGRLANSLNVEVSGSDLASLKLTLASRGVSYAATQELGATIKPRTKKALTIPLKAAMTPAGVTRKSAAAYRAEGGTFILRVENGAFIVRKRQTGKSKKEKLEFLFQLVRSATIPGPTTTGAKSRLGFFDTWDVQREKRREILDGAIERAVEDIAKKTGGG